MPAVSDTSTAAGMSLPWGAWHGDHVRSFATPPHWFVETLGMTDAPRLSEEQLEDALDAPVGARRLEELAAPGISVAIAIDDLTRPTQSGPLVSAVLRRLLDVGIREEDVVVVVASGAHRRAESRDIELKLGRGLAARLRVVGHDPIGDLIDTGVALGGVPARINRSFMESDLRIAIGAVLPHPFAGYGGGGKIVIPGLADLDVLARTHKYALMGLQGSTGLEGNRFRGDMEAAVRTIGLHWTLNVVVNSRRETAHVVAGDLVLAHRAAADLARRTGVTRQPDAPLDALVLNAYPKDGELLQIESALVALRSGMLSWLKPGAPIVLAAACSAGVGSHGLFGPGGRLFRKPIRRRTLGDHDLVIWADGLSEEATRTAFWDGYPFASTWAETVAFLEGILPTRARIGVVPCAPLQIASEVSDA